MFQPRVGSWSYPQTLDWDEVAFQALGLFSWRIRDEVKKKYITLATDQERNSQDRGAEQAYVKY